MDLFRAAYVRGEGGKKTCIKHLLHLSITLDGMYHVCTEEYPEVRISRSKFASLRPGHILLDAQMPKRVCFCWYHKNFIMLLETLPKVHPNIPTYSHEFPKGLVCVLPTEDCWNNKCSSSKDSKSKYHYYIKQKQSKV